MKNIHLPSASQSLVDKVEESILQYIKDNNLGAGDTLPKEIDLCELLGVARSVLREALSRLRMIGIIESRTRRGMVLKYHNPFYHVPKVMDPYFMSPKIKIEVLQMRVSLEIGNANLIFKKITQEDILELEKILDSSVSPDSKETDMAFHSKLFAITQNSFMLKFKEVLGPMFLHLPEEYIRFQDNLNKKGYFCYSASHRDIINILKKGTPSQYRQAMQSHLQDLIQYVENPENPSENMPKTNHPAIIP